MLKVTPQSSGPPAFFEKYKLKKESIGEGRVGKLYLCNNKATETEYACKAMYCAESTKTEVEREIEALKVVVGIPHILQFVDVFKNSTFFFLITDCCYGGELFDQITARAEKGGMLSEPECCLVTFQCMSAVKAMHEKGIVHRDLKPENIMLRSKNDFSDIVVIDLGLSRPFVKGQKITSRVGSSYYSPPEVEMKNYDESCDVWSLGINLYVMMCGYPPFDGPDDRAVYNAVKKGEFSYPRADWGKRSRGGPELISKMLNLDMHARPKPEDVLADPWIVAGNRHQDKLHAKLKAAKANGDKLGVDNCGRLQALAAPQQAKAAKPTPTRVEAEFTPPEQADAATPRGTSLDDTKPKDAGPAKKKGWF